MTNPFGEPYGSVYDAFGLGNGKARSTAPRPVDKPLPQIRCKRIAGVLYARAEDIADALASQAPTANRRLIDKLRKALT